MFVIVGSMKRSSGRKMVLGASPSDLFPILGPLTDTSTGKHIIHHIGEYLYTLSAKLPSENFRVNRIEIQRNIENSSAVSVIDGRKY